jgi:23S rRNA (pseudouridine1915-N3)-methyltransferase
MDRGHPRGPLCVEEMREAVENVAHRRTKRRSPVDWVNRLFSELMQISLVHVGGAARSTDPCESLVKTYLERCSKFARCSAQNFRTELTLFEWLTKQSGRTPAITVLLDSRGRAMTSENFAAWLGERRDEGAQHVVFAVGPASGWADAAHAKTQLLLSLGPMTLAHALARLVMAEQIYRAVTILTGHPYHSGH